MSEDLKPTPWMVAAAERCVRHVDGPTGWTADFAALIASAAPQEALTEEERAFIERLRRDLSIFDDPANDVMSPEAQHAKKRLGYVDNARRALALIRRLTGTPS